MNSNDTRNQKRSTGTSPAPKKRFRIEKLEERIAPKAHLNPQSKLVGDGNSDGGGGGGATSSGSLSSASIY